MSEMATDEQDRQLRVQRMVANRVTDEMLTKPTGDLTDAEVALLQAALRGPYVEEIWQRLDALNAGANDGQLTVR